MPWMFAVRLSPVQSARYSNVTRSGSSAVTDEKRNPGPPTKTAPERRQDSVRTASDRVDRGRQRRAERCVERGKRKFVAAGRPLVDDNDRYVIFSGMPDVPKSGHDSQGRPEHDQRAGGGHEVVARLDAGFRH